MKVEAIRDKRTYKNLFFFPTSLSTNSFYCYLNYSHVNEILIFFSLMYFRDPTAFMSSRIKYEYSKKNQKEVVNKKLSVILKAKTQKI